MSGVNVEDVYATHNWWGTTDTSLVHERIYDYYDDISLDKVIFEPIASQPYDFSGGSVSGMVTDSSAAHPISNACVSMNIGLQVTTDTSGEYLLEDISPGNYTLTVNASLYHSATIENITVSAGQTTNVDIFLDHKTTGTVSGQVLSAEGLTPIPNITVHVSNEADSLSVNSDASGNFTFDEITHGDYSIEIASISYWDNPQYISVSVDQTTQVLLVGIPQSIVGEIRNGWYTQEQLNQAVADAEAAKNQIIAQKDQTISDLNSTIVEKDHIITQKDQTISELNSTITSMFSQGQLDQAVLDERRKWDINADNKITLEEAIHALQVIAGIR